MLEQIHSPQDLKNFNTDELDRLSEEIREFLVSTISETGGHLAANLGVVELTIALLLEFDPFVDRIVWDVGHQSYVHKILTGRADKFDTLRKLGGLSGFPKSSESAADAFDSGHSSTSISAAAGFAAANKLLGGSNAAAVAVIGDGAMTGGMAFEAMNHIGSSKLPVVIVLNDNGMSISKNVGGLSTRLSQLRNTAKYFKLKSNVKSVLDSIPLVGAPIKRFIQSAKRITRSIVLSNVIFEDLGFRYLGPVDGHDISTLRVILGQAKNMNCPVIVHVKTEKGRGYPPAEKNPDFFHGVSSFDKKTGKSCSSSAKTWSDCFGEKLCVMAAKDRKIAAVTAAMPLGTGLTDFAKHYPDRFFDVAIAEQHAVTFSAALAKAGMTPVFAVYSTFLQRAYDQIIHDVSLMNLHTVFCIDRCGPVGSDGETHQGMYDIAYMSHIPYMTILSPSNRADLEAMLEFAIGEATSPIAIRYPRGAACELETDGSSPTRSRLLRDGTDVLIAAVGICVYDALAAADILSEHGISTAVADVRCVKPIDSEFMTENSDGKRLVATVEDGIITGGFGQQLECMLGRRVIKFAYPDEPIVQGSCEQLKEKYGMTAKYIAEKIMEN